MPLATGKADVRGRLNLFQRTMLQWRELYPYSAVHAVRVPQALDKTRLVEDIATELEALGLTGLELDATRGRFDYRGGAADVDLGLLDCRNAPSRLEAQFEGQLNRPFVDAGTRVRPFRFFVCDAGSSFYLGLVYDHFIAGGDSIVVLMKRLVQRYQGAPVRAPLALYPNTFGRLFLRYPGAGAAALARLPQFVAASRRCYRAPLSAQTDNYNAFASFPLSPNQLATLRSTAAAFGVTLNDLMLAMVMQTLGPHAAGRAQARRRCELAVASIMNIRREFQPDADHLFGQFLSSFRVSHPVPPGIALRDLAGDVHRQTAAVKSRRLYLQTLLALGAGRQAWRLLSLERRQGMFAKNFPVWAGVTALNADALWPRSASLAHPLEYVRAASTGPLAPLIFVVTTFAKAAHLGVVFRPAVFSLETVMDMVGEFLGCVEAVA